MILGGNEKFNNEDYYKEENLPQDEMPQEHCLGLISNLSCSIMATNLVYQVFDDLNIKDAFESHFQNIDSLATFHYFKSFRRVKINFSTQEQAKEAKLKFNNHAYEGQVVKCYFTRPIIIGSSSHLEPPKREKQFLISPPASPPVGWEPMEEAQPILNYDLLSAIAGLTPGEAHELHPPTANQPAIVVHICKEDKTNQTQNSCIRLQKTTCPDRQKQC